MLKWSLVKLKGPLRTRVDWLVGIINVFITTAKDTRATVDDWYDLYDNLKVLQEAGVLALVLFAFALLAVVLGFIGVFFGFTPLKVLANITHLAYVVGFLALILASVVRAILLLVSVLLGDACEMSLIFSENWTAVMSGKVGEIANVCSQCQSVIDVLELASVLDFARGAIQFPDIRMAATLDFSDFGAFAAMIQDADSSTFQVDQKSLDDDLDTLNTYTKQSPAPCDPNDGDYTEANILVPWTTNDGLYSTPDDRITYMVERCRIFESSCPATGSPGLPLTCDSTTDPPCTLQTFIGETYKKASTLVVVKVDTAAFVTGLYESITKAMTDTSKFKAMAMEVNDRVNMIKENLESSLFTYADDVEKQESCTLMKDGYLAIYNSLCGDVMSALTMISFLLFLVGVFLIPVAVCLVIAGKRLHVLSDNSRVGPVDDVQEK